MNSTNLPDPKPFRARLTAWFRQHGRDLPWRRDPSPYAVLVSEFMLQQTQVVTVIPYFQRWMARFPSFTALAEATEHDVLSLWQGLGYYARARNLHRAAQHVHQAHGGELPDDDTAIAALPGVGPYTAGAIASFAFDRPVPTVDGNIARVLARLLDLRIAIDSREGEAHIWSAAEALLPPRGSRLYTSALMELGALLCTARSPQCLICPVRDFCRATDPESLPIKRPRAALKLLEENCAWTLRDSKLLLEKQTGTRWKGLWKLPHLDHVPAGPPLDTSEYPFTNHRVTLRVFRSDSTVVKENQEWVEIASLPDHPLTAPHRRAIERLLVAG